MKVKARLIDAKIGLMKNAKVQMTFELDEMPDGVDALSERDLQLDVSPYRKKRSLDANAYAWVLIDRIASATKIAKEEVYRNVVRSIGGNSEIVCVKDEAVDRLCSGWSRNGIGWQTEIFPSKLKGCKNVILYYGSSTYDTEQMSRLIDSVIQECEQLEIPTKTPDEIANMLSLWESAERN